MNPEATTDLPPDILLAGATGLIGRELVRELTAAAASAASGGTVQLLLRRAIAAPAGTQPLIVDFAALPALPAAGQAYCALGTTIAVAGSQAAFRAVDHDAVIAFARAAQRAGVRRFAVVSALGASPHSGTFYNRVKGEAEEALRGLGFEALVIARPSLLAGDRAALGQPQRLGERLALVLTAPLSPLIPKAWRPIPAATVARALRVAMQTRGPGVHVIESAELQDLGAR